MGAKSPGAGIRKLAKSGVHEPQRAGNVLDVEIDKVMVPLLDEENVRIYFEGKRVKWGENTIHGLRTKNIMPDGYMRVIARVRTVKSPGVELSTEVENNFLEVGGKKKKRIEGP